MYNQSYCGTAINLTNAAIEIGYQVSHVKYAMFNQANGILILNWASSEILLPENMRTSSSSDPLALNHRAKCLQSIIANNQIKEEPIFIHEIELTNREKEYWYTLQVSNGLVYQILKPKRLQPKEDSILEFNPEFFSEREEL